MTEQGSGLTGGCLCGAVRYRVSGPLRDVVVCHCGQCRRTHGHVAAYTNAGDADLEIVEDRGLAWYRSSGHARRGFCTGCGASLFFKPDGGTSTGITAGTLDAPTGLKTVAHIYTAHGGDYYEMPDDVVRHAEDGPPSGVAG